MKIITVSREFGSGGRELGKRLADVLGYDYYDKEIINKIAANKGLDEGYVAELLEQRGWEDVPLTYRSSFSGVATQSAQVELFLEQKRVIEQIAKRGKDCVIVGRNADVLLREYRPFKIFVCATLEAKLRRCKERAGEDEEITDKELQRKMHKIDKKRAQTCDIISGSSWGQRDAYQLTVNTTTWEIKELAPVIAEFAKCWYKKAKK